jgi:phenylalanine-4-hydroxylase
VMRTRYRIDDFQESYFVLDSLDDLLRLAEIDFAPLYDAARAMPEIDPGEILPGDRVISRGTAAYHVKKRIA